MDALFIDEGFGSLDRKSIESAAGSDMKDKEGSNDALHTLNQTSPQAIF